MGAVLRSPPISHVELLSVLEVQIPLVRASYQVHTPVIVQMTEWERESLQKLDKGLHNRTKTARTLVDNALRSYAHACLRSQRLKDVQLVIEELDLFTCQMLVSEFAHMKSLLDTTLKTYQMPFKVLCERVVSRSVSHAFADDLHLHAGAFTQAVLKFGTALQTSQELAGRVLDYQPFITDWVDSIVTLSSVSTDTYNSLVKLNHIHHKNLAYLSHPVRSSRTA